MSHALWSVRKNSLRAVITSIAMTAMVACSSNESPEIASNQLDLTPLAMGAMSQATPESAVDGCHPDQVSLVTGYYNFPELQCREIAAQLDNETLNVGNLKGRCQQETGASTPPKSVDRVRIKECGPLPGGGSYASIEVCCHAPEPEATPVVLTYDADLQCPPGNVQAMTPDLYHPDSDCGEAVARAKAQLNSGHYKRACRTAAPQVKEPQRILHVAVVACRQEAASAVINVAVCCSGKKPHSSPTRVVELPTDIWEVLRKGDLFGLQLMLAKQPERAKEVGKQDTAPLHHASSLAMVNLLLSKGANPDARDEYGFTPLHRAVMRRNGEVVARFLELGVDVDAETAYGDTPLSHAPNRQIAGYLLDHDANPDGSGQGGPLHSAAFYGRIEVATLLLEAGAEIDQVDANGETPLHRAAYRKQIEMVRLLIEEGATVNWRSKSGRTPMDMTDDPRIRRLIRSSGGVPGK